MKVICCANDYFREIPNINPKDEKYVPDLPDVPIGTICTVIDEADYSGMHFYRFAEYTHETGDYKWWYAATCFIDIEKMSKVAVNTFYTKSYSKLAEMVLPNLYFYCQKHGYDLFSNLIGQKDFHFVKTADARMLLDKYDLVMSIEIDALITNPEPKIESFIDDEHDIFLTKDINGANGGVIIWKSTEFTKSWLEFIGSKKGYYGDEQNVFEKHSHEKIKYRQHPAFNSIPYQYYAPSYGYINFESLTPPPNIPTHEQGNWEWGDFVFHTPGKTLDERLTILTDLSVKIKQHTDL